MDSVWSAMGIDNPITFISILIVLATFVIGYLERRRFDRRQRTYEFLLSITEDGGNIHDANLEFALWISKGRVFENDDVERNEDKTIIRLLDWYNLVSDATIRGIIDKEMIISGLGGQMRSAYNMMEGYIVSRRNRLGRQGLYTQLETFVTRDVGNRII